jgi:hypothetical protein
MLTLNTTPTFDFYEDTTEGILESYTYRTPEDLWLEERERRRQANETEHNPLDPETMEEQDAETMRRFDEDPHGHWATGCNAT